VFVTKGKVTGIIVVAVLETHPKKTISILLSVTPHHSLTLQELTVSSSEKANLREWLGDVLEIFLCDR